MKKGFLILVLESSKENIYDESEVFEVDQNWKDNSDLIEKIKEFSQKSLKLNEKSTDETFFVSIDVVECPEGLLSVFEEIENYTEKFCDDLSNS